MSDRSHTRLVVDQETRCVIDGQVNYVFLYNLSAGGCMIEARSFLEQGSSIKISLNEIADARGEVVWQAGRHAGVKFFEPINEAIVRHLGFHPSPLDFDEIEPRDRFGRLLPPLEPC